MKTWVHYPKREHIKLLVDVGMQSINGDLVFDCKKCGFRSIFRFPVRPEAEILTNSFFENITELLRGPEQHLSLMNGHADMLIHAIKLTWDVFGIDRKDGLPSNLTEGQREVLEITKSRIKNFLKWREEACRE